VISIALTGGIASGKSTVLEMLSKKFPVIDSDAIVAELYKNKRVCSKIKNELGTCDKKELSGIVFNNKNKRTLLEKILHPLVLKEIKSQLKRLKKQNKKIAFVDVPLLFESGSEKKFDYTLCVCCTKSQQIERLHKKGFSRRDALMRINSQMLLKKKIKYADFVIYNNKSLKNTRMQINEFLTTLKELI